MTKTEQVINALESVEKYLQNKDLSPIGVLVQGKVLEALKRVHKTIITNIETKLIIWDKLNQREARIGFFTDQNGNHWISNDPYGVQMSGDVSIRFLTKGNRQYEVREVEI